MILAGARDYWADSRNCQELERTWQELGVTPILEAVREMFLSIPAENRRVVLELGCGTGRIVNLLGEFDKYTACDQSQSMIEVALNRFKDDRRVQFWTADMESVKTSGTDVVLCIEVLQHQADPIQVLSVLLGKRDYKYMIATMMVGRRSQTFGCFDGDGSRSVTPAELEPLCSGAEVRRIDHGELSTWVIRWSFENLHRSRPEE